MVGEGVVDFFRRNKTVFVLGMMGLIISSVGDLAAGATLGFMTNTLQLLPGLIVLIPPAIGMRGNIFGALGSRLGTSMHVGTFEYSFKKGTVLRQNLESSLVLTMIMSFVMGVLAKAISELLGVTSIGLSQFVFISVVGGVFAGLVLIMINILVAHVGYRRNWDIDNFSAPIITAAGDVVTLPMLFIAALIVLPQSNLPEAFFDIVGIAFLVITVFVFIRGVTRRGGETRRILIQSSPVLILCIVLDIGAGITIDNQLAALVVTPALLVMIPPFLEDANALGGILTSRLASMLHMGTLRPTGLPGKEARENFLIIFIFAIWVFTLVGITAHVVAELLPFSSAGPRSPGLFPMIALSLVAGLLTVVVLNLISYLVAVVTFRLSLDPDDHSIPLTSSAIDFVGALLLMLSIIALGVT
jgi:mgtE-like transporter